MTPLLKCLQDYFLCHGDPLYCELKHVRNALEMLQPALGSFRRAGDLSRGIEHLAVVHRILHAGRHALSQPDPAQLALF